MRCVWALAAAALLLYSAGCSRFGGQTDHMAGATTNRVVVELLVGGDYQRRESSDPAVIDQVQQWLAEVSRRQPPPTAIGSVRPWAVISLYDQAKPASALLSRHNIYSFADSQENPPLLTAAEQAKLRRLLAFD